MAGQHADIDHTGLTGVGGSMTVEDEGTPLATGATTLDFVGAGVTASGTGAEKTITIPGGGRVPSARTKYVTGDISVTSNTAGAALSGPSTLSIAAVTGDVLEVSVSTRTVTGNAVAANRMDVATIVSAAAVNYLSTGSGTPASTGISALAQLVSTTILMNRGCTVQYVVQAGDISGGNVELGLRSWNSAASQTVVVAGGSNTPLDFAVKNLGQ
jgi:hypothetical protein